MFNQVCSNYLFSSTFSLKRLIFSKKLLSCANKIENITAAKHFSNLTSIKDERKFENVSVESFLPLYKNKPSVQKQINHILNIYEHEKYTTAEVPTNLSIKDMKDLLKVCHDEKELYRSLKFFFKRECTRINSTKKKLLKKQKVIEDKRIKFGDSEDWNSGIWEEDKLVYGLWHNSLLSRITKQAVRNYRQSHLLRQAAMFGQKLIVDLDYDKYMKLYECRLLASQIGILYYENRVNRDFPEALPFDVHFTNCQSAPNTMEALSKQIKRMDQLESYFHHKSYLELPELFPREKLVYLSPHATESLNEYSHDHIYILGGYNDRSSNMRVSHIKAKSEGIRCLRLPLDENVLWKQGNKNLCLNQVAAILHSVKMTENWQSSILKFAPQRKIKSQEEMLLEDEIRIRKVSKRMKTIEKTFKFSS